MTTKTARPVQQISVGELITVDISTWAVRDVPGVGAHVELPDGLSVQVLTPVRFEYPRKNSRVRRAVVTGRVEAVK